MEAILFRVILTDDGLLMSTSPFVMMHKQRMYVRMKVTPCLYSFSTSRVTISLYNSSLDTMLQPIDTFPFGLLFALHQYSALEENVPRCSAYCTSLRLPVACWMSCILHTWNILSIRLTRKISSLRNIHG